MTEELLKKIEFEKFIQLVKEMLEEGHGEIQYRVIVKNHRVDYISLSKVNTYKPISDMINT